MFLACVRALHAPPAAQLELKGDSALRIVGPNVPAVKNHCNALCHPDGRRLGGRAALLLTTDAVVSEIKEEKKDKGAHGGHNHGM